VSYFANLKSFLAKILLRKLDMPSSSYSDIVPLFYWWVWITSLLISITLQLS